MKKKNSCLDQNKYIESMGSSIRFLGAYSKYVVLDLGGGVILLWWVRFFYYNTKIACTVCITVYGAHPRHRVPS